MLVTRSSQENSGNPECKNQRKISSQQSEWNHSKLNQMPKNVSITSLDPLILNEESDEDDDVVVEGTIDKPEWTTANVKLLLSWIEELHPLVGKCVNYRRKSDLWKEILRRFEEIGCLWTSVEVIEKFSELLREYKEAIKNNNQIGAEHAIFPFKSELDRLVSDPTPQYNNGLSYQEYWSKAKVNLLVSSFEELHPVAQDPRNNLKVRNMWKEIHRRFTERGYTTTKKQLYNKLHRMVRQYKGEISRGVLTKRTDIGPWRSNLARILNRWPRQNEDENEESVDDPDNVEDPEGNTGNSSEEESCNNNNKNSNYSADGSRDSGDNSQAKSDISQNEPSPSYDRFMNQQEQRRQISIECRKNRDIKQSYYRERQQYLKRKKEYLERKEAHMMRQEELLECILKKLDKKE